MFVCGSVNETYMRLPSDSTRTMVSGSTGWAVVLSCLYGGFLRFRQYVCGHALDPCGSKLRVVEASYAPCCERALRHSGAHGPGFLPPRGEVQRETARAVKNTCELELHVCFLDRLENSPTWTSTLTTLGLKRLVLQLAFCPAFHPAAVQWG